MLWASPVGWGQAPEIVQFRSDGKVLWTNSLPGKLALFEYSQSIINPSWVPVEYETGQVGSRLTSLPIGATPGGYYRIGVYTNPPDPSLVMHLSFNNTISNGVVVDLSGYGNHAYRYGRPKAQTNWPIATLGPDGSPAGLFRNYFDGWATYKRSGDYMGVPKAPSISELEQATISIWLWFYRAPQGNVLLDQTATPLNAGYIDVGHWNLGRDYSDRMSFAVSPVKYTAAEVVTFPDRAADGNTGGWNHYAVTFDRGNVRAFYNGRLCDEGFVNTPKLIIAGSYLGIACWTFNESPEMDLSVDEHPNNAWMNGAMDDVRIYRRVLADEEIASMYASFDKLSPTVPANVKARASAGNQVEIRWSPSTDNFRVEGYRIFRNGVEVGATTGTLFADTGLEGLKEYRYTVEAFDVGGNRSTASAEVVATTPGADAPVEVILDEIDGQPWVTRVGGWSPRTNVAAYGGTFIQDDAADKGTKSVTYRPHIPAAGTYNVQVWYPYRPNGDTKIPVDVITTTTTNTVLINQTLNGSRWVTLGMYPLEAGTNTAVRIRNDSTTLYVQADAVRFFK